MTPNEQNQEVLSSEQAQREWKIALDAIEDLIFIHDSDMRIVRANHAYTLRAGENIQDIIGKPYWKVFPKVYGPLAGCRHALEERQGIEELVHVESGEEYISRSYPIYGADGNFLYSLHVMQDITEKHRAETEQRTLSEALRQAAEAVVVIDAETRITYINPAFSRLFGYQPTDILGQPIAILSVPGQEGGMQPPEVVEQLNEKGFWRNEVWRQAKNGTAIPVRLSTAAIRNPAGNITGYVGTYLDLSEVRQAGQALRESENRLKVIMESVQTGITIIDPNTHTIVDLNSTAANMIGAPKEKIIGAICHQFICPAETGNCPITDLHQTVDHSERVLLTASGETRPIIKSVTTVMLGGKEHLLESYIDIFERKQMEQRLNESLAEKETLVKTLAELADHDGLTNLYNHRAFYKLLAEEFDRSKRFNRPFSLLMLDLDYFKRVNDTYGHQAGDAILRKLSEMLVLELRAVDRVCRYGGEEITIILPEIELKSAAQIAERLRAAVERHAFDVNNCKPLHITVSIGVASFPLHADHTDKLVAAVDSALYEAKQGGRNRIVCFETKSTN